jgi:hypothetical protein
MFQVYYRLKPFPRSRRFPGKSPAEVLGYRVEKLNCWTDFILPGKELGNNERKVA